MPEWVVLFTPSIKLFFSRRLDRLGHYHSRAVCKVQVETKHALLESTRQLIALSLGMRKLGSPGATQLRPRVKGDLRRALRVVSQSTNSDGDVDLTALDGSPTAC